MKKVRSLVVLTALLLASTGVSSARTFDGACNGSAVLLAQRPGCPCTLTWNAVSLSGYCPYDETGGKIPNVTCITTIYYNWVCTGTGGSGHTSATDPCLGGSNPSIFCPVVPALGWVIWHTSCSDCII
jgi:hypothetical protein